MNLINLFLITHLFWHSNPDFHNDQRCKTIYDTLTKTNVYTSVEIEPQNAGGMAALMRAYSKLVKADSANMLEPLDLKYIVAFIVSEKGQISGQRIVYNKAGNVGRQMLKAIQSFTWTPGKCDGKNVPVLVERQLSLELKVE